MLFNIESDTGDRVVGYIVPEGFTGRPSLSVRSNGETLLVLQANDHRDSLVAAGRHETGLCGFVIDTTLVPDLPHLADLELFEAESNTLIYRRRQPHFVAKKILRIETHLLPLVRLDDQFSNAFQYRAIMIDRYGRETVTQLFLLDHVDSVYLSGRILHKNYAYFADTVFKMALTMHEPYVELAERLLLLRSIRDDGTLTLGMRDAMNLKPALGYAAQLPLDDEKALGRALRNMPPEVAAVLTNPVVRQLTTATPDEMPGSGAVAFALDVLATFAVVGVRAEPEAFQQALAELTETDPAAAPLLSTLSSVQALGDVLRRSRAVDHLIEKDRELYGFVAAAFKNVA